MKIQSAIATQRFRLPGRRSPNLRRDRVFYLVQASPLVAGWPQKPFPGLAARYSPGRGVLKGLTPPARI